MTYYVLVDHMPVETDMEMWIQARQDIEQRRVADTHVDGETWVSTVFLGIDHSFGGAPVLFETMVFRSGDGQECWRYCTWDAAKAGHDLVVAKLRAGDSLEDVDPSTGGES